MNRSHKQQRVHIIDDDPSICEGLSNLLESVGIETTCYSSAEEFRAALETQLAGCILLDARLPGLSGPEFQDELVSRGSEMPVIFMTAHGDMPMVRKVLKAGALEFLFKPFQKEELLQAVHQAFAIDSERQKEEGVLRVIQARIETLTERERETLALVTAGLTNKEIGDKLHLSVVTVKLHRGRVMRKMQAESLADLVRMWERIKPSNT